MEVSATMDPEGTVKTLEPLFRGKVTLLIGQSGMGKSTILNLLVKDAGQRDPGILSRFEPRKANYHGSSVV